MTHRGGEQGDLMYRRVAILGVLLMAVLPSGARADGSQSLNESYRATIQGGGLVSEGVGLAARAGGGPSGEIAIAGIPATAFVERAFLYWAVLAGDDADVALDGNPVHGTLIGRSADTCWFDIRNPDPAQDNRVYRADVTSFVDGDGTYTVSGVGDVGGVADGQGASLVVAYGDGAESFTTTIVINDGALTGGMPGSSSTQITHMFSTGSIGAGATNVRLHAGVGDTSAEFPDAGMKLGGTPVVPSFEGSDGALWDDVTVDVAGSSLAGPSTQNHIDVGDDCMVWTYAALEARAPAGAVAFTQPEPGAITRPSVHFAGTSGQAAVAIRISEGPNTIGWVTPTNGTWSGTFTFSEGWHTVRADGFDQNNQQLPEGAERAFRVDVRAPSVSIDSHRLVTLEFGRFEIDGRANDDSAVDRVVVHWRDAVTGDQGDILAACSGCGTGSATWRADVELDIGTFIVTARAYDAAGNQKDSAPPLVLAHVA